MNKKIEVKQDGVKIIVDFATVWAFMWRWFVLAFGIAFCVGILAGLF